MLFLFIFALTISGIMCEEEDVTEQPEEDIYEFCKEQAGGGGRMRMDSVPDETELQEKCPAELEFFKCLSQKMEENNWDETFAADEHNMYKFIQEICDPDSELQKEYLASVGCYKTMVDEAKSCFSHGKDAYKAHYRLINHILPYDVDGDWIEIDAMCMVQSVTMACLSDEILKECGTAAYSTIVDMVGKSQYLHRYCSPDVKNVLLTSLLDNMELEDDTKDVYKSLFEIIKK